VLTLNFSMKRHLSQAVRKQCNQFCHMMDQRLKSDPRGLPTLRRHQALVVAASVTSKEPVTMALILATLKCKENMAFWVLRRLSQDGFVHDGIPTLTGRELQL